MSNIGAVSYTIGGCAFLVLSVLLATSWRGRFKGGVVVAAACMSVIWCFWLAYQASVGGPYTSVTFLLEVLRGGAWLSLLVALLRGDSHMQALSRPVVYAIHSLWILALGYGVSVAFGLHTDFPVWVVALLAIALVGLVLLEQLFRNARPDKRWALKFLILGIGAIFVYDFFLYSQALLLRGIEPQVWNARGAVNALAVPLIAVAATRNPDWSVDVFVSRHVVFYTTALLGAGLYLLAMAAGGYYIQVHGGTWGAFAQIVFLGGAALMLAVIMLSAEVRAKLRVFLIKHFYKGKYEYRIEWLGLIHTLAAPDEANPFGDRALKALAQIVESPGGALWLRQERGDFRPVAHWGIDLPTDGLEPADSSLMRFLEQREWVIDIGDWRTDPTRYDDLLLPGWLGSQNRAWLVVPLMQENQLLAFVVLMRSRTFGEVTWEDTDLLKTVGRQVASYLAYQRAAQELAEAKQFDAYHRLTAFIMHDVKNLIAQQSLVVKNAARHKNNLAFIEDVIRTVDNSVTRMNQLLDQLKHGESQQRSKRVALRELLTELIAKHAPTPPAPELQVLVDQVEVLADQQGLTAVLGHIVRNAQEATTSDGHVWVRLARQGANAVVEVEDDGTGMEPAFVAQRLFRPFDSTKGSKGMGIGAYQAREFVRAAGGDVEVTSAPGKGTTLRIILPILGPEQVSQPVPAVESRP
jgi:putative PEP-CTERM system histidine kinase